MDIDQPWNIRLDDLVMVSDGVLIRSAAPVHIGHRCVISQYCTLLTEVRDDRGRDQEVVRGPITIADDCWVATDTLVLPGSTLEPGVVVGARGMVAGRIEAWRIATVNPRVRVGNASSTDRRETPAILGPSEPGWMAWRLQSIRGLRLLRATGTKTAAP